MSNRSKEIERVCSCIVDYSDVYQIQVALEAMRQDIWLSKTCCCGRHGLRGVPANRVDVLVDRRLEANESVHPKGCIELSIVAKKGRFDGSTRDRLSVRMIPQHTVARLTRGFVSVAESADQWAVSVLDYDSSSVLWSREYERLRSDLSEYDPERLVLWHWTRYYQHLEYEIAASVASYWALTEWAQYSSEWTLAEANRSASRALYRASRNDGWRKLTLRERRKVGISDHAGQWHRADAVLCNPCGVGDATLNDAAGRQWSGDE